jgi:hypothetical protein
MELPCSGANMEYKIMNDMTVNKVRLPNKKVTPTINPMLEMSKYNRTRSDLAYLEMNMPVRILKLE